MLVKPKCVREMEVFFDFRKFVYIFQLFVDNFSMKIPPDTSQTHFGFTNMVSEMLITYYLFFKSDHPECGIHLCIGLLVRSNSHQTRKTRKKGGS